MSKTTRAARGTRLLLEILEDRTTPAFIPIPLGAAATRNLQGIDPTFPSGNLNFLGVPFHIASSGNNVVWNNDGPPSGTIVKNFPVNVAGVTQVQTLINTTFGQRGPNSYLTLDFLGSNGASHTVRLIGNQDIRDLYNGAWTNSINGTSTVNVFITPSPERYRIDKQTINLPAEFASQTLTSIRMTDTGAFDFQRAVVYGITAKTNDADIHMQSAQLVAGNTVQFTYSTTGNPGQFGVSLFSSVDGVTYNPADRVNVTIPPVTPNPATTQQSPVYVRPAHLVDAGRGQAVPDRRRRPAESGQSEGRRDRVERHRSAEQQQPGVVPPARHRRNLPDVEHCCWQ